MNHLDSSDCLEQISLLKTKHLFRLPENIRSGPTLCLPWTAYFYLLLYLTFFLFFCKPNLTLSFFFILPSISFLLPFMSHVRHFELSCCGKVPYKVPRVQHEVIWVSQTKVDLSPQALQYCWRFVLWNYFLFPSNRNGSPNLWSM